jgi:hypothetical protein
LGEWLFARARQTLLNHRLHDDEHEST